jgi:hypothetical protein
MDRAFLTSNDGVSVYSLTTHVNVFFGGKELHMNPNVGKDVAPLREMTVTANE